MSEDIGSMRGKQIMNNKINHSKITVQIIQYCKDNINSGVWRVGEKIPSEKSIK